MGAVRFLESAIVQLGPKPKERDPSDDGRPFVEFHMLGDAGAEPEVAKVFFKAAERLGQACRDLDAEMAIALSPTRIALDNGSGQEVATATAAWRKRRCHAGSGLAIPVVAR